MNTRVCIYAGYRSQLLASASSSFKAVPEKHWFCGCLLIYSASLFYFFFSQ